MNVHSISNGNNQKSRITLVSMNKLVGEKTNSGMCI